MDVYLTTCLSNGKIYIGKNKNSDPNYYGSGTLIKRAMSKYGKKSFTKEILSNKANDKHTLDYLEKFFIKCFNSTDINVGYNIAGGGDGGDIISAMSNKEEIYAKRATGLKSAWDNSDHEEWGKSISKGMKSTNISRGEKISKSKNYKFVKAEVDPNKAPPNCKKVLINGIVYNSAQEASRELEISYSTLRNRIKSDSFPEWKNYESVSSG